MASLTKAMSFLLSRRILGLPKKLGLAGQRAIRMLGVIHPMVREESDLPARLPAVQPFPLVPNELPTDEARSGGQAHDPDTGRNSPQQRIMARGGSDFSAELRAAASSIRVSARPSGLNDQFSSDRPSIGGRIFRSFARFFIVALIAALIGVAASSAWQSHGDEAKRMVTTWRSSLGWLLSASMTKSPPDLDSAAKQPGPAPAGRMSAKVASSAAILWAMTFSST
jgi:hypothetical protein